LVHQTNKNNQQQKFKIMTPVTKMLLQKTNSSISKKLFVAAIAIFCLTASAFATGDEANEKAAKNLKTEYKNAKDVQWKVTDNYIKASFSWNSEHLEVYYNKDGETIADGRMIRLANLPMKAQQYLQDKYADYTVTEAIEYTSEETGLCYYVSVNKEHSKSKILEITPNGDVSIYR
jgi:hypothetical protein